MSKVYIIAAVAKNGVIGVNNTLPWVLPEDLKHFRKLTMGQPCIQGRKTYESIGKALPGRKCFVISKTLTSLPDAVVVPDLEAAIAEAKVGEPEKIFVIGGQQIYYEAMDVVDGLYITHIRKAFDGDAYFPLTHTKDWELKDTQRHVTRDPVGKRLPYSFDLYERRSVPNPKAVRTAGRQGESVNVWCG